MELKLLREEVLGMKGFEALFILAVFKKSEMFLYKMGSHVKSCFIILNSFKY